MMSGETAGALWLALMFVIPVVAACWFRIAELQEVKAQAPGTSVDLYLRTLKRSCVAATVITAFPVALSLAGYLPMAFAWVHAGLLAALWGVSLWATGEIARLTGRKA